MKGSLPRRTVSALGALLLLAVSSVLTACDPDQVGAAAVVDGEPIRVEELQRATQGYLELDRSIDQGTAQRQILSLMVDSEVVAAAARKERITVTQAEVAAVRERAISEAGGRTRLVRALAQREQAPFVLPPSHIDHAIRAFLLESKLAEKLAQGRDPNDPQVQADVQKALAAAARSLDIEVNPRYGSYDVRRRGVSAQIGGGLSKSVREHAAAAEGK